MSTRKDKNDRKLLPTNNDLDSKKKPSSSPSPPEQQVTTPLSLKPTLKLTPKATSSLLIKDQSQRVTRSAAQEEKVVMSMALSEFIAVTDRLSQFEARINAPATSEVTLYTLQIRRDQIRSLWDKVEKEYEVCLRALCQDANKGDITAIQGRYETCYSIYERCAAQLNDNIEHVSILSSQSVPTIPVSQTVTTVPASQTVPTVPASQTVPTTTVSQTVPTTTFSQTTPIVSVVTRGCNLPPCDTEVFHGDYLKWPTFRDLFKAIYIDNPRLTAVEKLFHLNAKTSGEAKAIVAKSPLTHEGFASAWDALHERYNNKRLLVNSQLKILFNLQAVGVESGSALKELQTTIQSCLLALDHSKISIASWDCLLIFLCSAKLPKLTLALWEQSLSNKSEIPSWQEMNNFLSERYRTLEAIEDVNPVKSSSTSSNTQGNFKSLRNNSTQKRLNAFETKISNKGKICDLCLKENHPVRVCPRFLQMSIKERESYIKQKKLCLNCFARGHQLRECTSSHNCFTCKGRHNTLLHRGDSTRSISNPFKSSSSNSNSAIQSTSSNETPPVQNYFASNTHGILLGTAIVSVVHLGVSYTARALIDSGSEGTFISERLFKTIKLPYQSVQAQVSGLNQAISAQPRKLCHFYLAPRDKPRMQIETSAYVLPSLAGNLPSCSISQSVLKDLPNFPLADPSFSTSSQIDVLIGADILPSILLNGVQSNVCGTLVGQETIFGWIITGPVPSESERSIAAFSTQVNVISEDPLDNLLTKFWEVEEIPTKVANHSDNFCEQHFLKTTRRDEDGRYVVSLPFRDPEHINLGHSRSIALAQFLKVEARLNRDAQFKSDYNSIIQEYASLGHMKQVSNNDCLQNFYLPHHAVFKPESSTTKVRIVFNASSRSSNGTSLNDVLYPGPVLQSDLTIQILKWRLFQFVFNADIEKMYRQIRVDSKHTPFQRILFRNERGDLCDFELNTVTFGVNCAPFLAIRVLQQLSSDVREQLPLASEVLSTHMYVNDVLAEAHSEQVGISTIKVLQKALDSAGFPLRKWTANKRELLEGIPTPHLLRAGFLEFDDTSTARTLGIRWRATQDEFNFVVSEIELKQGLTKREVLSQIAKLFDPAGWLAPFVVRAKLFMQAIWLTNMGWDDPLPPDLLQQWHEFLLSYSSLNRIRIPRWVHFAPNAKVQIHGFCDASQRAYGAAIYIRVRQEDNIFCHLLVSKTRVAPVKSISLPRLELCGAVLLAKMVAAILPNLPLHNFETFLWTDSTIVLAWLDKPPCRWTTFVANRVAEISQATSISTWRHVRSEDNPADLASRGVASQDLVDNALWWHGPNWLSKPQEGWPKSTDLSLETDLEQRPVKNHLVTVPAVDDFLSRFSDLGRALRVLGYMLRFVKRCRKVQKGRKEGLHSTDMADALRTLVQSTQRKGYSDEYHCLLNKKTVAVSSQIRNLNPFLDANGIIRAMGRVRSSGSLSYDERHPILLPYDCSLSRLLVNFTHRISLHGGKQLVIRLVRSKFWIPKLQNLVKSVVNSCKVCIIHKKKLQTQLMGDLPKERVTFSRPFTYTGIDFAGPFEIKSYLGRACRITKGYVCVFVCFTTKAIHLEGTSDLTTDTFLAAFARFVARRGCPHQIQSDNGKTFVGASRALNNDFLEATRTKVTSTYNHQGLSWRFIPPGAPHMGGLWEAGVKSFKALFYKSTVNLKYTFEEFSTLLSKVEACLNSRPISPMSEDSTDPLALTPGHFLVGGPLLAVTEPEIQTTGATIINRWQKLKTHNQQFCQRWKHEYLKELHKRNKWQTPDRNIQEGDMVIVKEDNLPSCEWRLGRVQKGYPGSDDKVRVVDILTTRGSIKRPISKLILLPTNTNVQSMMSKCQPTF